MSDAPIALVLDLLEWLAVTPRPYAQVMDAWRTSCPKLPVWEDVSDQRLVTETREPGGESMVHITPLGRRFLEVHGRTTRS